MSDRAQPFAAGPVLSASYTEAIATLPCTWRAGAFSSLMLVSATVLLTVYVVMVAAAVGAAGSLMIASVRTSLAFGVLALLVTMLVYSALASVGLAAYAVLLAPGMQAMYRAHARYLDDEVDLTLMDGARGAMASWSLNAFLAVSALLEAVGYLLFFVPGVVVSAALSMVAPAMVVHGLSLPAAVRRSLGHFLHAPMWHLTLALADAVVLLGVGTALPVVGLLLTMPLSVQLHLRAYQVAFGLEVDHRRVEALDGGRSTSRTKTAASAFG